MRSVAKYQVGSERRPYLEHEDGALRETHDLPSHHDESPHFFLKLRAPKLAEVPDERLITESTRVSSFLRLSSISFDIPLGADSFLKSDKGEGEGRG